LIFLFLSIIASTLIFIIFKGFNRYNINTLQAIVINYGVAGITGLFNYNATVTLQTIYYEKWFIGAICLGGLFISIFNVMALTAQRNGLSVASVASKMSVVIPILFGLYVYHEQLSLLKGIAIVMALIAVYLTSQKRNNATVASKTSKSIWLPLILFLGSGVLDTTLKYLETTYVASNAIPLFSAIIFFSAGAIGLGFIAVNALRQAFKFEWKTLLGGTVLGIVNYYSIYLLLKALQYKGFESSTLFTINNVSIVMLSTLVGLILFKEQLSPKNWIGIALAVVSILLIAIA
jgi:drug/metabolite transporter (DMT)-like permease